MTYQELMNEHSKEVTIFEHPILIECEEIHLHNVKGLYKSGKIAIDSSISELEKKCVLAEELGHHYTSTGNILDYRNKENQRQEFIARLFGALILVDKEVICSGAYKNLTPKEISDKFKINKELGAIYTLDIDHPTLKDTIDSLIRLNKIKKLLIECCALADKIAQERENIKRLDENMRKFEMATCMLKIIKNSKTKLINAS